MSRAALLLLFVSVAACDGRQPVSPGSGAAGSGSAGVGSAGTIGAAGAGSAGTTGAAGAGSAGTGWTGAAGAGTAGTNASTDPFVKEILPSDRDVDILFMVDNSKGMSPIVNKLLTNFSSFVAALDKAPAGPPNLHLAVVTSDIGAGAYDISDIPQCRYGGDQGIFQDQPRGATCGAGMLKAGEHFITRVNGATNYIGSLASTFACIAAVGDTGCGFEHQFGSVLRGLGGDGYGGAPVENANFLRPNALLQVVLVTNEDDCSAPINSTFFDPTSRMVSDPLGPLSSYRCNEYGHLCRGAHPPRTPAGPTDLTGTCTSAEDGILLRVADVAARLKGLKTDPSKVLVAAIAGPPTPYVVGPTPPVLLSDPSMWPVVQHSCVGNDGSYGDPSIRIKELVNAFGSNGAFDSACGDSLAPTLTRIAQTLVGRLSNGACVPNGVPFSDPPTYKRPDCTVVDHTANLQGGRTDASVPHCAQSPDQLPCWELTDTAACFTGRHFNVRRAPGGPIPDSSTVTCQPCTPGAACPFFD